MKKILQSKSIRFISTILVVALMAFLIIKSATSSDSGSVVEASDGTYSVTIVNVNENAGTASIALKNGDAYVDTNTNTTKVPSGTKVKFYYKDGLNSGYSIYMWANYDVGQLAPVKVGEDLYTSDYLIQTIKSDLTVYVIAKSTSEHVVTFYDSSVSNLRNIIGVDIVKTNEDASFALYNEPTKKGFTFVGWNDSLSNVTSDLDLYPVYDTGIWSVFRDYYPMFFKGLGITLLLSIISVFCALFLGIILCLMRLSNVTILRVISATYVEIIRGVPLLLQLLVIYVVLGPTKIHIGSFFTTELLSCLLALFINSGAYSSEIFRSGIQAVDKGQMEAGRALGMSKFDVMLKIVIPQGIKNSLPSIGNELVSIIKETSLAVSVDASIGELMSVRKQITAATYINLPPYIIVAIIYFCVTFSLSKFIGYLEKRLASHEF